MIQKGQRSRRSFIISNDVESILDWGRGDGRPSKLSRVTLEKITIYLRNPDGILEGEIYIREWVCVFVPSTWKVVILDNNDNGQRANNTTKLCVAVHLSSFRLVYDTVPPRLSYFRRRTISWIHAKFAIQLHWERETFVCLKTVRDPIASGLSYWNQD